MKNTAISIIRGELEELRKHSHVVVNIDKLILFIDAIGGDDIEDVKRNFERDICMVNVRSEHGLAMFNSVVEAGLSAVKSGIIINGGAAVSLLAFIGGGRC
ncbi:MAG TPA: hypothetical protein DCW68_05660 [Rhodospirillaceae bacterium]|nr:MAG: hypothetical protein A2018_01995 [Alphaproteobacteria bacterium GWF2_58_20]HAU29580.1 hypothetical protein [Rhodospirillaceae bacterium]